MGLFGSTHCVTMCGGVSSLLCAGRPGSPSSGRFSLAYNAGRVASYTALGLIAGALGTMSFGLSLDFVRFAFRAFAAICMLTAGLHLLGLPSFVRALESLGGPLWRRVAPFARGLFPLRTPWHALAAGALWALMPCGLLYGALALAAGAASPLEGAATMAAFGAGTLPVMLAVGVFAHRFVRAFARSWACRLAGAVMLAFGLWATAGLVRQTQLGPSPHTCCPHP
jgi:sulfite exporter TauE/SafE